MSRWIASRTGLVVTYVLLVTATGITHIFRVKFSLHSASMCHNHDICTIRTKFRNDFRYFLRLRKEKNATAIESTPRTLIYWGNSNLNWSFADWWKTARRDWSEFKSLFSASLDERETAVPESRSRWISIRDPMVAPASVRRCRHLKEHGFLKHSEILALCRPSGNLRDCVSVCCRVVLARVRNFDFPATCPLLPSR